MDIFNLFALPLQVYIIWLVVAIICLILFYVVLLLIFRPFILWYFKINKLVKLQEETNRLLKEIAKNTSLSYPMTKERDHSAYMPKDYY